jgi:hypothetical protein
VSSWIDESLILSEIAGVLLLLAIAWILVLKNQLWQHWLRRRYQPALEQVASALGLVEHRSWRGRLEARGRHQGSKLFVQWRAGVGPHKIMVRARRGLRRRTWVGAPDTPPEQITAQAERLISAVRPR